jgi:hypothetical protein
MLTLVIFYPLPYVTKRNVSVLPPFPVLRNASWSTPLSRAHDHTIHAYTHAHIQRNFLESKEKLIKESIDSKGVLVYVLGY